MIPDVHYARTPEGVHIAYGVIGDGPIDVVYPGWGYSNIGTCGESSTSTHAAWVCPTGSAVESCPPSRARWETFTRSWTLSGPAGPRC
jgi:hypothetical protein